MKMPIFCLSSVGESRIALYLITVFLFQLKSVDTNSEKGWPARETCKKRVTSCTHREEIWAHRGLSIGSLRSGWPATVLASRGKPVWTAADLSPVPVASEDTRVAWYPPA